MASVNDAAFPVQIQEELLNQVRYWTSQAEMKEKLNQEYDTKINEQERIIDALNKQRRLREESEGVSHEIYLSVIALRIHVHEFLSPSYYCDHLS